MTEENNNKNNKSITPIILFVFEIIVGMFILCCTLFSPLYTHYSIGKTVFFILSFPVLTIIMIMKSNKSETSTLDNDQMNKFNICFMVLVFMNIVILATSRFEWTDELIEISKEQELQKGGCYYIYKERVEGNDNQNLNKTFEIAVYNDCPYVVNGSLTIKEESCDSDGKVTECIIPTSEYQSPFINGEQFNPGVFGYSFYLFVGIISYLVLFASFKQKNTQNKDHED